MGKIKRVTCIATPMLLTGASLACFVVVMCAQNYHMPLARDIYFMKVQLSARCLAELQSKGSPLTVRFR